MTINRTTLLDLPLPVTGTESGVWGDVVNNGLSQYIDISVAGSLSLSADSDTNLSSTEGDASATNIGSTTAQYAILRCTGARTATRNINAPAWAISGGTLTNYSKIYIVVNETTGSQNIVLRATNSATPTYTTGVTIVPGERAVCAWNGSDFVKVGGAAGGSTTQVQYNNAGVFAGSANFVFDGTNVGIGASSPADRLDVRQAGVAARFTSTNGNANQIALSNSATAVVGFYMGSPAANVLQFSDSTGTERMRITSAGLVGIGTTTPNTFSFNNLVVASGSANAGMAIYGTGQTTFAFATGTSGSDSYRGYIQYTGGGTDTMTFGTVATERMRIDSSGNVMIGLTSQNGKLTIAMPTGSGTLGIQTGSITSNSVRLEAGGSVTTWLEYRGYLGHAWFVDTTERMRITNTGNLLVGTTTNNASGGVIQVSNGITFPATQSASSDANTLDDYEEGTFTADVNIGGAATGITYTGRAGKYTKIGNLVYVSLGVTLSSKGSLTGNITITGLPFASSNTDYREPYWRGTSNNFADFSATITTSATTLQVRNPTTTAAITDTTLANNSALFINGCYQT